MNFYEKITELTAPHAGNSANYVRAKLFGFVNKRILFPLSCIRSHKYLVDMARESFLDNPTAIEGIYISTYKQPTKGKVNWAFTLRGLIIHNLEGKFVRLLDKHVNWVFTIEG